MKIYILTLFPEIFESVFTKSIISRAIRKKILEINLINIRDFGLSKHKQVDDKPYGGGEGMVMMAQPIIEALAIIKPKPYTILLSASGTKFSQKEATAFARKKSLAIICGHYEGVDARVEKFADEVISIGDFILTGGEIPAMTIIDSVARLIPGVIKPDSIKSESFSILNSQFSILLEYPQYTRPELYKGLKVPSVLLNGNHKKIEKWRCEQSVKRTKKFRPDLIKNSQSVQSKSKVG